MPLLRSDTMHVSDSEPEREALRRARDNSNYSSADSAPNSPLPRRAPLSTISNTGVHTKLGSHCPLDSRLEVIERDIAEIKDTLKGLRCRKRSRTLERHETS
ncbi:hypothetical protein B0H12DRAFT_1125274 [Mycena haematopus]|nr:hypothetical protein B0H12DRAFT_1138200 [Mycena haematopus]KAJ7247125.1 hypothetical protein B0H12DRAFT_1125274 [Mycena haematopus]